MASDVAIHKVNMQAHSLFAEGAKALRINNMLNRRMVSGWTGEMPVGGWDYTRLSKHQAKTALEILWEMYADLLNEGESLTEAVGISERRCKNLLIENAEWVELLDSATGVSK
jgi:hypothetical protein